MKYPSAFIIGALSALSLWLPAAYAGGRIKHDCAMEHSLHLAPSAERKIIPSLQPNPPAHAGHPSAAGLGSAIQSAVKKDNTCRLSKAGKICPMGGKSILRHGPCCAEECRKAPPAGQNEALFNLTDGFAAETAMTCCASIAQTSIRIPVSCIKPISWIDSPEPRPPSA